jgi:hypothetical protein
LGLKVTRRHQIHPLIPMNPAIALIYNGFFVLRERVSRRKDESPVQVRDVRDKEDSDNHRDRDSGLGVDGTCTSSLDLVRDPREEETTCRHGEYDRKGSRGCNMGES